MLLRLPTNLHYPITITKVEVPVGDYIKLNDNLFLYSYTTKVMVGERGSDEEQEVDKKFVSHFGSTLEGMISGWRVWEGDVIEQPVDICEVEEECTHAVQYLGMCTNCGKDMTALQPGGGQDTDRATIQPLHDTQYLTISQDEANEIDKEAKRRLLTSRKLSLVVDLDQTIIHAAVDPTIAEWQKDKDNPNYDAVKDVKSFRLIDEGPGMKGCSYYIKLRPGLQEFLEHISQLYELHIYTMGTRQYAQQVAQIVDPDHTFFGDRILSRDESGSMVAKNLERLFPVDTKMVVIIDDRGDVWKWSANLVRVTPFDFFVGIGDINSSFLPKKQDIQTTPATSKDDKPSETGKNDGEAPNGRTNGSSAEGGTSLVQNGTSALEQLVAMSGSDDPALRQLQSKGQEEIISSQLEEKPLLKRQQELDELDEAEAAASTTLEEPSTMTNGDTLTQATTATQSTDAESDSSSSSSSTQTVSPAKSKARHSLLKDDDTELHYLEASLTSVHTTFFKEYDRKRLNTKGGRVSALAGKRKQPLPEYSEDTEPAADLNMIPDVKKIMPSMKLRVLSGVVVVFSGVLPLGTDIQTADISTWAKTFGVSITDKISSQVTHVIAARAGTAKVKQAVRRGIKVVGTSWLVASMQQWKKLDERPYLLEGTGQKGSSWDVSSDAEREADRSNLTSHDFMLSSSEDETDGTGFADTDADGDDEFSTLKRSNFDGNEAQGGVTDGISNPDDDIDAPPRKRLKLNTNTSTMKKTNSFDNTISSSGPTNNPDDEEDTEDFVDDGSPVTINQDDWADMDAELKEFMGSEVDSESDNDSVSSKLSLRGNRTNSLKRRRKDDDQGESSDENESRVRVRGSGGSALRSVKNALSESERSTPTSGATGGVNGNDGGGGGRLDEESNVNSNASEQQRLQREDRLRREEADEEDSEDDELARELERELEEGSDEDDNDEDMTKMESS